MYFFSFYHWLSRKNPNIPSNVSDWPAAWKTAQRKVYPNAPTHKLPVANEAALEGGRDLHKLLYAHSSDRGFSLSRDFDLQILGIFLQFACGEVHGSNQEHPRKTYPSGGALYPIEVYVYLRKQCGDIKPGIYHYRSDIHALEQIRLLCEDYTQHPKLFGYKWARQAHGAIFLTGVFDRSAVKYSERAYRYTLLEAGHISQNVYLVGHANGLKITGLGGTRDEKIEKFLRIDGYTESLVHTLMFG